MKPTCEKENIIRRLPSFQSRVHSVHTTLKTPRKKMSANPHACILIQYAPPNIFLHYLAFANARSGKSRGICSEK